MVLLLSPCLRIGTKSYDITRRTSPDMLVYSGDPKPVFEAFHTIQENGVNISRLTIGSHTGTHIDAPYHFLSTGNPVDKEPIDKFIGEAVILDLSSKARGIRAEDLDRNNLRAGDILLIYTGTGEQQRNFAYLELDAAKWIVDHGIKSVGIDTLSIEKFGSHDAPVHKLLLGHGIGIIENLGPELLKCANKRMFLVCLFLPLVGLDGSPARAVLFEIEK